MRYRWDPVYSGGARRNGAAADAHLRADDRERNEVADTLSRHFADGRLDAAEFKERLDRGLRRSSRVCRGTYFLTANTQITPPCGTLLSIPILLVASASWMRWASTPQPDWMAIYCVPSNS